ncbi:periplasmic nitrate reductase, large subunit, partial [Vibrio cholerae CP1030(3)]
MYENDQTCV